MAASSCATALGVFVDKEAHRTLLQIADNHKQLEYIKELRHGVQELTNYGHQARQHIGELSAGLLECDVNLEACDTERIALLQREKIILDRTVELKVENTKLREQNKLLVAQLEQMKASHAQ